MIRVFRTDSETVEIPSDAIFKITNIALIITSENSLNKAAKIYGGMAKKIKSRNGSDIAGISEIINLHFFIGEEGEEKEGLTARAYCMQEEAAASETLSVNGIKLLSIDVKRYKKLSEDYFIKKLFRYDFIVFFLAAGASVRIIAPFLKDKFSDPGVITIDEAGKFVVSLLSGHIGGANKFAEEIAGYIGNGAIPVITTATDATENFSLDMFAERFGLFIEDGKSKIKIFNKASVCGEELRIYIDEDIIFSIKEIESYIKEFKNAKQIILTQGLNASNLGLGAKKAAVVSLKENLKNIAESENIVLLRPRCLTLGIGCNRNTPFEEIEDFISSVFKENNLSLKAIRNIATINLKRNEAGLLEFGYKYGNFIDFYDKDEINAFMDSNKNEKNNKKDLNLNKDTRRSASFKYTGAYSVCEPCAQMSAKNGAKLLIPKQKKGNVTAAAAASAAAAMISYFNRKGVQ